MANGPSETAEGLTKIAKPPPWTEWWEQRPSGIERYPLSCHECMRDFRLSDPCRNQGLRSQKASFKMLKQT